MEPKKLNLGCEYNKILGYQNIDINPETNPDICCDAKKLSHIRDASIIEIIASHILEHFLESEVRPALREWNRVLIPGGVLFLVVPDVEKAFRLWAQNKITDNELLLGFLGSNQEKTPFMLHKTFFWKSRIVTLLWENNYDKIEEINIEENLAWLQIKAIRKL